MKISKDLNLVVQVPQEDGPPLHVHAMPIALSMFNDYALVIGEAMMRVYGSSITFQAAPRMIAPTLEKVAAGAAARDGAEPNMPTAYHQLLAEVHRRAMVLVPNGVDYREEATESGARQVPFATGYDSMMLDEAIKRDLLDADDLAEVDGSLLFFSAAYRFHGKSDRRAIVTGAAQLWHGFVTLLNSTEYAASLRTSTEDATSGATAAVPRSVGPVSTETGPDGVRRAFSLPS